MKLCSLLPKVSDFLHDFIINYLNAFPSDREPDKVKGCVFLTLCNLRQLVMNKTTMST